MHYAEDQGSRVLSDASQRPLPQAISHHMYPCFLFRVEAIRHVRVIRTVEWPWVHRTSFQHHHVEKSRQRLQGIHLRQNTDLLLRIRQQQGDILQENALGIVLFPPLESACAGP